MFYSDTRSPGAVFYSDTRAFCAVFFSVTSVSCAVFHFVWHPVDFNYHRDELFCIYVSLLILYFKSYFPNKNSLYFCVPLGVVTPECVTHFCLGIKRRTTYLSVRKRHRAECPTHSGPSAPNGTCVKIKHRARYLSVQIKHRAGCPTHSGPSAPNETFVRIKHRAR